MKRKLQEADRTRNKAKMRQLKGKTVKENSKMKRARKEENLESKRKALYIALPVLALIAFLIVLLVYAKAGKKKVDL